VYRLSQSNDRGRFSLLNRQLHCLTNLDISKLEGDCSACNRRVSIVSAGYRNQKRIWRCNVKDKETRLKRYKIQGPKDKKLYHIVYTYGISKEEYLALIFNQKGKCAICKKIPKNKKGLFLDHCHNSKKIRGLLCSNCNSGLGMFLDDVKLLRKAVKYLKKNN
jgi:hypothetical protein